MPTPSTLAEGLNANMREVARLVHIQKQIAGDSSGREHDVEILDKSAIVLVVACWEAFVEDVCEAALEFIISHGTDYKVLPDTVLESVASKHGGRRAWDFAGDGWKQCLKDNLSEVLARTTGKLNTPKTAQVNELFKKTLGLRQLSSSWSWRGRSKGSSERALDDLVTLRGSIAHRIATEKTVRRKDVQASRELVARLAVTTSNAVRRHVHSLVGRHPWRGLRFGRTT